MTLKITKKLCLFINAIINAKFIYVFPNITVIKIDTQSVIIFSHRLKYLIGNNVSMLFLCH